MIAGMGRRRAGTEHDWRAKTHAVCVHAAAKQKLIVGRLFAPQLSSRSRKNRYRNVMMSAGIGAAANLDAQLLNFWIGVTVQLARKHVGERERPRNSQRLQGSKEWPQGHPVTSEMVRAPRNRQVQTAKLIINRSRAVKRHPRNHQILVDRNPPRPLNSFFSKTSARRAHLIAVKRSGSGSLIHTAPYPAWR